MKHLAIITSRFDSPTDYLARSIKTLAHAFVDSGIRTTVCCPVGAYSSPLVESAGCLAIHRIEHPEKSAAPGFAIRAAKVLAEANASSPLTAIECYDTPESIPACFAARSANCFRAPIISIASAPSAPPALADHHLVSPDLPLPAGQWTAPDTPANAVVVPVHLPAEDYESISEAFAASNLEQQSWTLAVAGFNGGWMLSTETAVPTALAPRRVLVIPNACPAAHLAARHAIASGHICVISNCAALAKVLPSAAADLVFDPSDPQALSQGLLRVANPESHTAYIEALQQAIAQYPTTTQIIESHDALWSADYPRQAQTAVLSAWKFIEQACAAPAPQPQEAI